MEHDSPTVCSCGHEQRTHHDRRSVCVKISCDCLAFRRRTDRSALDRAAAVLAGVA